jgi:5-methylcytosine-specific restriction endonuclease McrA
MAIHLSTLSDAELDREAKRVAQVERDATVELIRLLIEVERRGLHLALGHSSLFAYCTRILRLSEQSAYRRITAARAVKRYPRLLELLADGSLSLSSVGLLVPQLTEEIGESLIEAARFKSTREVERLIAAAFPQPDVPTQIRARSTRPETGPSSGGLFTTTVEQQASPTVAPLKRTPDLASPMAVVTPSRTALNRNARRSRTNAAPKGRSIPAAVKREVWRRDAGRCSFSGPDGLCGETAFLEYHHVIPFAAGGPSDASNLQLRCRAHNAYEARMYFGHGHANSARAE